MAKSSNAFSARLAACPTDAAAGASSLVLQRYCGSLVQAASLVMVLTGMLNLLGWYGDIAAFKTALSGTTPMRPNTGLCFVLGGAALWTSRLVALGRATPLQRQLRWASVILLNLIAWVTVGEYLFNVEAGIDSLLYSAPDHTDRQMRMAFATAVAFALSGSALYFLPSTHRVPRWISQVGGFACALIGLIATIGYLYGVEDLHSFYTFSSVAVHTAVLLMMLGLGIVFARTDFGFATLIISQDSGGFLTRRILPIAILAPFIIGWLRLLGEQSGYYGTPFGLAIFAAANVTMFVILIGFAAHALNRKDAEQRPVQEALQLSRQQLRDIIDGLGPYMYVGLMTREGILIEANRPALEAAGLSAAEVIGKPFEDTYWWAYSPEIRQQLRTAIVRAANGEASRYDVQMRIAHDQFATIDFSIQPLRNRDGAVTFLIPSGMVITERKKAEEALRTNQQTLQLTLDAAHIGYWELDLVTLAASRSLKHDQIFGYPEGRADWTYEDFLSHVHPEDKARVDRLFQAGVAAKTDWDFECRIIRADGVLRWIWGHGNVFTNAEGQVVRMLGMVNDISDRKEAEAALYEAKLNLERKVEERTAELNAAQLQLHAKNEQLTEQNRRVEEASRLKSEFLANMSHELRTPLNAIIGFSELMHDGKVGKIDPEHKEYLGDILNSAHHLLHLINDVLDLAKVESGKMEFYYAPVNLRKLIDEVCDVLRTILLRTRISVSVEIEEGLHEVAADAAKLKQVLYNYLSNAIKFSTSGSVIEVRALLEDKDAYRLEVEDRGIGIRPEDLPQLFAEFQQLDNSLSKKYQGTGLGLALTKRIVEAQGGRVGVTSTYGKGSLFYAVLPRGEAGRIPPALASDPEATNARAATIRIA